METRVKLVDESKIQSVKLKGEISYNIMEENELLESLTKLLDSSILGKKVKDILQEAKWRIVDRVKLKEEKEHLKEVQVTLLKAMIGQPIYWASPGWKMETHTITGVEYRIYDSDFFDKKEIKYKGKKCVVIELDNCGNSLADFIGKNLFFDKEEALSHTRK